MKGITFFVSNLSGRVRRETRQGREYLVAPVTMIVPGVLHGNQGPLLYPEDELPKNLEAWNGIPILLGHPEDDSGQHLSGKSTHRNIKNLGTLYNSSILNKNLVGEAWIDVELARRADNRIVPKMSRGEAIEVSTGLFILDKQKATEANATYNGVPYSFVARNYHPDHLAVLMDVKGACSVADGCGLNVNDHYYGEHSMDEKERKRIVDLLINSCCWEEGDRETLNALPDVNLKRLRLKLEEDEQREKALNESNAALTSIRSEFAVNSDVSLNELPEALKKAAAAKPAAKDGGGEDEEEEDMDKNKDKAKAETKNLSWDDIQGILPNEVKEDLAFAKNAKAQMKQAIVDRLVSGIVDEETKKKHAAVYNAMSLESLQAIDPGETEKKISADDLDEKIMNWAGVGGGPVTTPTDNSAKLKPLPSYDVGYEKLSPINKDD